MLIFKMQQPYWMKFSGWLLKEKRGGGVEIYLHIKKIWDKKKQEQ